VAHWEKYKNLYDRGVYQKWNGGISTGTYPGRVYRRVYRRGIEARAYQLYRDICETVLRGVLQGITAIYRVEVGQYVAVLLCVGIGEIKSPI